MIDPMRAISVTLALGLAVAVPVACAGDDHTHSGVELTKPITDLTVAEVTTFCTWAIDVQGGEGHVTTCGDGVMVVTPTQAECEAEHNGVPAACSTVTVEEMEACVLSIGTDPCAFGGTACAEFYECSLTQ
jgi:hypothetical protein